MLQDVCGGVSQIAKVLGSNLRFADELASSLQCIDKPGGTHVIEVGDRHRHDRSQYPVVDIEDTPTGIPE